MGPTKVQNISLFSLELRMVEMHGDTKYADSTLNIRQKSCQIQAEIVGRQQAREYQVQPKVRTVQI